VIDGPPLLVSEAKALAVKADGTIIVFNTASTRRGMAKRALRELREVNANIVGTVLLGVKSMKGGYFDEVYRSYQQYQQVQVNQPI
jgi:Mrp family chromosome partitioning ATPase